MNTRVGSQVSRTCNRASAAVRLSLLAGLMLALNGAQAAVDTASFPYSMGITFSGYTGASTLANFPALVVLTNGLSGFSYGQMKSPENGGDLRFTDEGRTTWLNYEIETWNTFSGTAVTAPTELPGCALWLRADAGVVTNESGAVTNWVDQSGNGRNAVQTDPVRQPLYDAGAMNGLPAVTFDGAPGADGDQLYFGDTTVQTLFIVNRVGAGAPFLAGIIGKAYADLSIRRNSNSTWSYPGNENDFTGSAGSLFAVNGVNTGVAGEGVWHVLSAQRGAGAVNYDMIGGAYWNDRSYKGDIAEIIAYNRALSANERTQVGLYIKQKYGLGANVEPGKSCVWVQVPALAAGTTIYAYWGNPDASPPASTMNGATWDSSFAGVWHALSKTDWSVLPDATAGVYNGANNQAAAVPGVVGNAMNFNMDLGASVGLPAALLSSANNAITVSLWQYGSAREPVSANIFEATSGGLRVLGSHLPWWDGLVFWDAGTAGAFDRVYKGASAGEYKGQWNHWAFTKDTGTGVMRIYLNGEVWQEGGGLTQPMTGADTFRLGSAASGGYPYDGVVDEFRVANVAQSADWIKASFLNQSPNGSFATYGDVNLVPVNTKPYRCSMRIDFTGYTGSETLYKFPALVVLTNGMPDFAFSQFKVPNGGDLRFTDGDKSLWLNYEIEQWPTSFNSASSPETISGLVLWLKADAGVQTDGSGNVTGWQDQSGNGYHASQPDAVKQPLYTAAALNGLPAVTFDGGDATFGDRLFFGDVAMQTVFIVNRVGAGAPNLAGVIGKAGADLSVRRTADSTLTWSYPGNEGDFTGASGSLFNVNGANTAVAVETQWHVLMAQRGGGAINCDTLGGGYYGDRSYKGDVAEVVVYNRALSVAERSQVSSHLLQKYGLAPNTDAAKAVVWVQVPEMKANTSIWAYWDNPDATRPAYTTNGATWTKNYAGVWHALNPADATVLPDSTAGLNGGSNSNVGLVSGLIGEAMSFNGANAFVNIPAAALSSVTNEITISLWQYGTAAAAACSIFEGKSGTDRVLNSHLPWGSRFYWDAGIAPYYDRYERDFSSQNEWRGQWNNWVFVKNATTSRQSVYLNGVFWGGRDFAWRPMNGVDAFSLGSAAGGGAYYTGLIDEFRIQNVSQSPDWIKASFLNQAENSTFSTYGTIQKQIYGTLIFMQ